MFYIYILNQKKLMKETIYKEKLLDWCVVHKRTNDFEDSSFILYTISEKCLVSWLIFKSNHYIYTYIYIFLYIFKLTFSPFTINPSFQGMSGRTLRKIPFLAYTRFIESWNTTTFKNFLKALDETVIEESTSSNLVMGIQTVTR